MRSVPTQMPGGSGISAACSAAESCLFAESPLFRTPIQFRNRLVYSPTPEDLFLVIVCVVQ